MNEPTKPNDGGPAFPSIIGTIDAATGRLTSENIIQPSLSKRELFAAMAMQGVLGNNDYQHAFGSRESYKICARDSVTYADALLAELEKGGQSK